MDASANARSVWEGRRAALVISHPGHELLVHGWLEQAKPVVFVLTAGEGETPAIATTTKIVQQAGAIVGSLFGRFTERGLTQTLQLHENERFFALAQELADVFVNESIEMVVGDSAEGFDPAHDLCRLLIDAAVSIASQARPGIRNFEFPLIGGRLSRLTALKQRIEGEAWQRKFASCRAYPEPIEEVARHLATASGDGLREECLRLTTPWAIRNRRDILYTRSFDGRIPALQFGEHMLPIADSMQRFVNGTLAAAA